MIPFAALFLAALPLSIPELMAKGEVPGVSMAIVRGGKVQSPRAYGVANAETGQPLTTASMFESASLAKPIFAFAVLRLVDDGVLSLDEPLATYLAEPLPDDARMQRITARMVLAHTSGLPNHVRPGEALQVSFEPGARFQYSGEGYLYLQRVVEHLTHKPLPQLLRELVFAPLRMRDTTFAWNERLVHGHSEAGSVKPRRNEARAAMAMLHTTPSDYARFLIVAMKTPHMHAPQVAITNDVSWTLGWGLERSARGNAIFHWGENNGDTQHFAIGYPNGDGLVIFTNSGNGLSIVPELVHALIRGEHPAFAWMGYEPYTSPAKRLLRDVMRRGVTTVPADLSEAQLNRIGYVLLERRRLRDAIAIFRAIADRHPDSFNAFDSLGEAYAASGDREQAIGSYQRSLELNPKNTNAVEMLRKLRM